MVFNGQYENVMTFSPFHTMLNVKTFVFKLDVFMVTLFCSSEAALNAMGKYLIKKRKAPDIKPEPLP